MKYIIYCFKNIFKYKNQYGFLFIITFFIIFILIIGLAYFMGTFASIDKVSRIYGGDITIITTSDDLKESDIKNILNVLKRTKFVEEIVLSDKRKVTLFYKNKNSSINLESFSSFNMFSNISKLLKGNYPSDGEILLPDIYMNDLKVGDNVMLVFTTFDGILNNINLKVSGFIASNGLSQYYAYTTYNTFKKITNLKKIRQILVYFKYKNDINNYIVNKFNNVNLNYKENNNVIENKIKNKNYKYNNINKKLYNKYVEEIKSIINKITINVSFYQYKANIDQYKIFFLLLKAIFLIFIIILMVLATVTFNTNFYIIFDKISNDFGVFIAFGMKKSKARILFIVQNVIFYILSFFISFLVSIIIIKMLNGYYLGSTDVEFYFLLFGGDNSLHFVIDAWQILFSFALFLPFIVFSSFKSTKVLKSKNITKLVELKTF